MSAITIALTDATARSAKPVLITVPRTATIAELQARVSRSAKPLSFSVAGFTPSRTAVVGDLFDVCSTEGKLEMLYSTDGYMGGELATNCCLCFGYKGEANIGGSLADEATKNFNLDTIKDQFAAQ